MRRGEMDSAHSGKSGGPKEHHRLSGSRSSSRGKCCKGIRTPPSPPPSPPPPPTPPPTPPPSSPSRAPNCTREGTERLVINGFSTASPRPRPQHALMSRNNTDVASRRPRTRWSRARLTGPYQPPLDERPQAVDGNDRTRGPTSEPRRDSFILSVEIRLSRGLPARLISGRTCDRRQPPDVRGPSRRTSVGPISGRSLSPCIIHVDYVPAPVPDRAHAYTVRRYRTQI
jgi:hypothetical protein